MKTRKASDSIRSNHVAALDGLRGIAVAAVVAYHVRPELVPGGFLGVDLFFVLSGYLITSLLLDERARTGGINLLAFAGRRLRRLLPAILLVVVAVVIHESIRGEFGQIEQARRHALATLAYVANWIFISDGNSYFADVAGPSMFRHVWSLAVEEQFYLLWPATVFVVTRFGGRRAVGATAFAIGLVSVVWMAVHFVGGDPSRVYFGTDTRIFEPLIGAVGAVVLPLRSKKPEWLRHAGAVAAVAWIAALFLVDDNWGGFYEGGAGLLGLIALLAVVGATMPGPLARVTETTPLVWLGVISYGVYLWHWPILLMMRQFGWRGIGVDVAVVGLTLIVSALSYFLVERPIRRAGFIGDFLGRRWRPIGAAAASMLIVGAFVIVMTRTDVPADAVTFEEVIAALDEQAADETPDRPTTVVLIGDSAAWTLGGGWVSPGADHGPYTSPFDPDRITLVNLARQGYRLTLGATEPIGATDRTNQNLEYEELWLDTIDKVQPDLIVAMFGLNDMQGIALDDSEAELTDDDLARLRASHGGTLIDALADMAPVVILGTPHLVGVDMADPDTATVFQDASNAIIDRFNQLLAAVSASDPAVQFLDYGDWLCPGDPSGQALRDGCRPTPEGEAVRYDGIHYSEDGALLAAEWLTEPLLAAADTLAP